MMATPNAASWAREYRREFLADEMHGSFPHEPTNHHPPCGVYLPVCSCRSPPAGIMTQPPRWTLPHPATVLCASATVPLREMRAVAHL